MSEARSGRRRWSHSRAARAVADGAVSAAELALDPDAEESSLGDGDEEGPLVPGVRGGQRALRVAVGQAAYDVGDRGVDQPVERSALGRRARRHRGVERARPQALPPRVGVQDGAVGGPDDAGADRNDQCGILLGARAERVGGDVGEEGAVATDGNARATIAVVAEDVHAEPVDAGSRHRQRRVRQAHREGGLVARCERRDAVERARNGDPVTHVGVGGGVRGLAELFGRGDGGVTHEAMDVDRRPRLVRLVGHRALDHDGSLVRDVVGRDGADARDQGLIRLRGVCGGRVRRGARPEGGGAREHRQHRGQRRRRHHCQDMRQRGRAEHPPMLGGVPPFAAHYAG